MPRREKHSEGGELRSSSVLELPWSMQQLRRSFEEVIPAKRSLVAITLAEGTRCTQLEWPGGAPVAGTEGKRRAAGPAQAGSTRTFPHCPGTCGLEGALRPLSCAFLTMILQTWVRQPSPEVQAFGSELQHITQMWGPSHGCCLPVTSSLLFYRHMVGLPFPIHLMVGGAI